MMMGNGNGYEPPPRGIVGFQRFAVPVGNIIGRRIRRNNESDECDSAEENSSDFLEKGQPRLPFNGD